MIYGSLYVCEDCGHVFEEPNLTHNGGYWEEPCYECPACGSSNFDEADQCVLCEEYFTKEHMSNHICEKCLEKAVEEKAVEFVRGNLMDEFSLWLYESEVQ